MYFFEFRSQYKRFLDGKVSAPDFAYWLFAHNDEMESGLNDTEWASFAEAQHLAAEYTGDHIDDSTFRAELDRVWTSMIVPLQSIPG